MVDYQIKCHKFSADSADEGNVRQRKGDNKAEKSPKKSEKAGGDSKKKK